ncbi:hypothetical protein VTI74DRAFT_96 [Chaetomium olivicolor]
MNRRVAPDLAAPNTTSNCQRHRGRMGKCSNLVFLLTQSNVKTQCQKKTDPAQSVYSPSDDRLVAAEVRFMVLRKLRRNWEILVSSLVRDAGSPLVRVGLRSLQVRYCQGWVRHEERRNVEVVVAQTANYNSIASNSFQTWSFQR